MSSNKMRYWLFAAFALLSCAWAAPAHAAVMFWSPNVTSGGGANCNNGTYAWDADSGTAGAAHKCWATATGGTTAAAVPGVADVATLDASSGGGTVVVVSAPNNPSGAAQVNLVGLTTGLFTGTLNFNTNNNNVTMGNTGFSIRGPGRGLLILVLVLGRLLVRRLLQTFGIGQR